MMNKERTESTLTNEEIARIWQCGTCNVTLQSDGDLRRCPSCGRFANVRYLLLREQVEARAKKQRDTQ